MKLLILMFTAILTLSSTVEAASKERIEQYQARDVIHIDYGPNPAQVFDLYLPAEAQTSNEPLPIIMMVHGGAWSFGDKARSEVVD